MHKDPNYTCGEKGDGTFSGRNLVVAGAIGSDCHLWLRPLGSSELQPLAGTNEARLPFWSDSRYIGFFADGKLKNP